MDWNTLLTAEKEKDYFKYLTQVVRKERQEFKIYPESKDVFNAFKLTPFKDVKVVIIGQDPYHGAGQAMGLSFSVNKGVKIPPSLRNIYKELETDIGITAPEHGDLTSWAEQGVLLLNSTLTVRSAQPNSHSEIGWQRLTHRVIRTLVEEKQGVIFLLWGAYAQKSTEVIGEYMMDCHVLKSPHPSPFSAHSGFFGCKHFSKANKLLTEMNKQPIDWKLDP